MRAFLLAFLLLSALLTGCTDRPEVAASTIIVHQRDPEVPRTFPVHLDNVTDLPPELMPLIGQAWISPDGFASTDELGLADRIKETAEALFLKEYGEPIGDRTLYLSYRGEIFTILALVS